MTTQKQGEAAGPPEKVRGWLTARLPDGWFEGRPEILIDREAQVASFEVSYSQLQESRRSQ